MSSKSRNKLSPSNNEDSNHHLLGISARLVLQCLQIMVTVEVDKGVMFTCFNVDKSQYF